MEDITLAILAAALLVFVLVISAYLVVGVLIYW